MDEERDRSGRCQGIQGTEDLKIRWSRSSLPSRTVPLSATRRQGNNTTFTTLHTTNPFTRCASLARSLSRACCRNQFNIHFHSHPTVHNRQFPHAFHRPYNQPAIRLSSISHTLAPPFRHLVHTSSQSRTRKARTSGVYFITGVSVVHRACSMFLGFIFSFLDDLYEALRCA